MSEFSELVQNYYQNPVNNYHMDDATVSYHEWNAICGDDITAYLKLTNPEGTGDSLSDVLVTERSFDGNVSMITQAAASFFSELVVWKKVSDVLQWNEQNMIDNWFEVSTRRKRSRVIALLATHNAIHQWLWDGKVETFEDVLLG